jgi:hypothetical protein
MKIEITLKFNIKYMVKMNQEKKDIQKMILFIYENINKWYEYENITIEEYISDDDWYFWRFEDKEIEIKRKVWLGDILDYFDNTKEKINPKNSSYEGTDNYYILEKNDNIESMILSLYENKRFPIESQNKECIIYLYNYVKSICDSV